MSGHYDNRPTPLIERLARIEGGSNFESLLRGIEAGPDTTELMGALGFARSAGATPEVLEAHVAQSGLFSLPIMSLVFWSIVAETGAESKEWPWMQGAVADAFNELRYGPKGVKPLAERARSFKVRTDVYAVMRRVSGRVIDEYLSHARARFHVAMRRETDSPGIRHSDSGEGGKYFVQGQNGCYRATPLGHDDDGNPVGLDTRGIGISDRLGYDVRNDAPGPVLTLYGGEAEDHCRKYPAQSFRPQSF